MLIDHLTAGLLDRGYWAAGHAVTRQGLLVYRILRGVGRLAFPIYCFLIVEGFFHTRNKWKYLLRLTLFGIISEIPFDICFNKKYFFWEYQNVFFTLALGLLAVILIDELVQGRFETASIPRKIAALAVFGAALAAGNYLETDYGAHGVAVILCFYLFRDIKWFRAAASVGILTALSLLEAVSLISFLPIHFYNGERGRQSKYFFYIFYPAHLLLIALARGWLFGIFVR